MTPSGQNPRDSETAEHLFAQGFCSLFAGHNLSKFQAQARGACILFTVAEDPFRFLLLKVVVGHSAGRGERGRNRSFNILIKESDIAADAGQMPRSSATDCRLV